MTLFDLSSWNLKQENEMKANGAMSLVRGGRGQALVYSCHGPTPCVFRVPGLTRLLMWQMSTHTSGDCMPSPLWFPLSYVPLSVSDQR